MKKNDIYRQISEFWARQGFYVAQISPYELQGQSYESKIGLRREFYLRIDEQNDNTYIDVTLRAQITDLGLVGGVAAAVIFWPAAVVGGALSYSSYKDDARNLMYSFWAYVDSLTHKTGAPMPVQPPIAPPPPPPGQPQTQAGAPPPPPAVDTTQCESCGAILPKNWKACPYCAKPVSEVREKKESLKEEKAPAKEEAKAEKKEDKKEGKK